MGISGALRARPFYTGGGVSSAVAGASDLVPYKFPVSLGGYPYMVDTVRENDWGHETVPLLREQSDSGQVPGETSLNPEGPWRRTSSSWHKGAGQTFFDREESSPYRFADSVGVNVWERYEVSLLPDIDGKKTSSNTNLKLLPVGSRLFCVDGATVTYTTDITAASPTWVDCTNEPGGTILDMASDGKYVWITDGSASYWALATASPPAFNLAGWTGTQDADVLEFVKGRLVSAHDNTLHTYDAAGAATAITIAGVIPDTFTFVGFAGGPTTSVIYAAGYAGDKSIIFRIAVKEDGTGLDVAVPAGELPDGEIVASIYSYLGFVLIGTNAGVRFATPDSSGNLTIGALLETSSTVRCFEGQGSFVWFGWEDYSDPDGTAHHGLGRLSLEEFSSSDGLAPAYATDLMSTTNGDVTSVCTFNDRRVFAVEGTSLGVYAEEATLVSSGKLWMSTTDYGFVGDKIAAYIDATVSMPSDADVVADITTKDGTAYTGGTISTDGASTLSLTGLRSSEFSLALTLNRATVLGPVLSSVTLRAVPGIPSTRKFHVPLLLSEHLDPDGGVYHLDVGDEYDRIAGWWTTRDLLSFKELDKTYLVTVDDYRWFPRIRGDSVEGFAVDGTMLITLKEV